MTRWRRRDDEPGSRCYSRLPSSPLCSALHRASAWRGAPHQWAPEQARRHTGGTPVFLPAGCSCLHCPAVALKWRLIPVSSFLSGSLQTSFMRPPRRFNTSPSTPAPVSQHLHSLAPLLWAPRGWHSLAVPLPQEVLLLSCPRPSPAGSSLPSETGDQLPSPLLQTSRVRPPLSPLPQLQWCWAQPALHLFTRVLILNSLFALLDPDCTFVVC